MFLTVDVDFDPAAHPRGQPKNAGQFAKVASAAKPKSLKKGAPTGPSAAQTHPSEMTYAHAREVGSDPAKFSDEHLAAALKLLKPSAANKIDRMHRKRILAEQAKRLGIEPKQSATPATSQAKATPQTQTATAPVKVLSMAEAETVAHAPESYSIPTRKAATHVMAGYLLYGNDPTNPVVTKNFKKLVATLPESEMSPTIEAAREKIKKLEENKAAPTPPAEPPSGLIGAGVPGSLSPQQIDSIAKAPNLYTKVWRKSAMLILAAQVTYDIGDTPANINKLKSIAATLHEDEIPPKAKYVLGTTQSANASSPTPKKPITAPTASTPKPPRAIAKPAPGIFDPSSISNWHDVTSSSDAFVKGAGIGKDAANYKAKMSQSVRSGFAMYSGSAYKEINNALRSGDVMSPEMEDAVDAMDSWFHDPKSKLGNDVKVWRAAKLPPAQWKRIVDGFKPAIYDPGLISTSARRSLANGWGAGNALFELTVRKGTPVAWIADCCSVHKSEAEMVLPRGTPMKITGYRVENGKHIVEATV